MPKTNSTGKKHKIDLPFVSVCTPTFNRRPFIKYLIKCFNHQDYPKDRIEWIIIDDGTDKIEDLVKHIPQVKYYKYSKKMALGEKRNLMHTKTKGDILVYMDDDDFYPPDRISHAVEKLQSNPDVLCAGSSELYIYFKHLNQIVQFGPYGPNHATAGTFAFKRKLLEDSKYNETASLAEEREFLKGYTVPFIQLDPLKTILVFSHEHNTYDKRKLLVNPSPSFVKKSDKTVDLFIKNVDIRDFYMNRIEKLLAKYEPGKTDMKPDVLKQLLEIEESRRIRAETECTRLSSGVSQISRTNEQGEQTNMSTEEVIQMLSTMQRQIKCLYTELDGKNSEIKLLQETISPIKQSVKLNGPIGPLSL